MLLFYILVCEFSFLSNGHYSNLFNLEVFSGKSFSGETSVPVKISYLLTCLYDKARILAICLSKLY